MVIEPVGLAERVRSGERAAMGRAITLLESRRPDHHRLAQELLAELLPFTGASQRVGITGVPGVGKSTLIDQLGVNLTAAGHRVAVLAVDPSSSRTGGSILGDKTRMARLAVDERAFIRPSPAGDALGGVGRVTRETILLCEAAGYDTVLVETVGVGQSETMVADMVDCFVVLMLPGAGDELQGIKKGVLELADIVAVNKADGGGAARAEAAASEYRHALHLLNPASPVWSPPVLTCSGLANEGLDAVWAQVELHRERLEASGERAERRRNQRLSWMWALVDARLHSALREHPRVAAEVAEITARVHDGVVPPTAAADRLWELFAPTGRPPD